jgi:hypothetical protein
MLVFVPLLVPPARVVMGVVMAVSVPMMAVAIMVAIAVPVMVGDQPEKARSVFQGARDANAGGRCRERCGIGRRRGGDPGPRHQGGGDQKLSDRGHARSLLLIRRAPAPRNRTDQRRKSAARRGVIFGRARRPAARRDDGSARAC